MSPSFVVAVHRHGGAEFPMPILQEGGGAVMRLRKTVFGKGQGFRLQRGGLITAPVNMRAVDPR
ncbi:hypothetical protein ACFYZ1_36885 [Streptomyces chartreusis]|uniref:hypothetical protein n=1 Tax=Streptomyces chartreusis TaxID=1969 RepID=UPI0036CC2E98